MSDGRHESVESAEITIDGQPITGAPEPTWLNRAKHYAKAIVGGLVSGLLYFLTVLAPTATVGDITLMQWIGFWVTVLGTSTGVAFTTNGAKPAAKN